MESSFTPANAIYTPELPAQGLEAAQQAEPAAHHRHDDAIIALEPRNLVLLTFYHIVVRIGWIFKTESVIVPAFLDVVSGAGWLRGFLPVLNRFGQSLPPLFYVRRLERAILQKRALAFWSMAMGIPFVVLGGVWMAAGGTGSTGMAIWFLVLYGLFSMANGLNQLCFGTVQGKLIRPIRKGVLLAASSFIGSGLAIAFAWWLLTAWLKLPDGGFGYIFGFTGICFILGAGVALAIAEPPRKPRITPSAAARGTSGFHPLQMVHGVISSARDVLRRDANFRQLALVASLFSTCLILFPHYQAMARERLQLTGGNLMVWVVVQNAAVGVCGLLIGPLADRRGNRLALRLAIFVAGLAPLVAIGLVQLGPELGQRWFWTVFLPLGLTPIALKLFVNYTLEISPIAEHARYLSTLSLALALPFFVSPLVGWLVDVTSFELIFLVGVALMFLCGLLTFRLQEPRVAKKA